MSAKTKIQWADATWNPVTGCTPVSIGCEHCYAKRLAGRFPKVHGLEPWEFDNGGYVQKTIVNSDFSKIIYHPDRIDIPSHWRKPKKIFVSSMGDLFHPDISLDWIEDVFDVIEKCPQHIFMILTKRPENANKLKLLPKNIWLGVTIENQDHEDRIQKLLPIPAAKRFVSVEPMLGPLDLKSWLYPWGDPFREGRFIVKHPLDWVICGPETGPGARSMNLDWARSLRDQCVAAGVPFFYKPGELDGKLWHQWPEGNE